jgi:hypothetical protein
VVDGDGSEVFKKREMEKLFFIIEVVVVVVGVGFGGACVGELNLEERGGSEQPVVGIWR